MKRISSHLACTRLSHVRLFRTAGPLLALIACAGLAAAPATAQSYTLTVLGTLGGSNSVGYGVNDAGQVAGWSQIAGNNATHAFLSAANGGALTDLGTLSGGDSFGFGSIMPAKSSDTLPSPAASSTTLSSIQGV